MEAALHKAPRPDAEKGPGFVTVQTKDCGICHGRHMTLVNRISPLDLYEDLTIMFVPICDIHLAGFFSVYSIGYPL